MKDEVAALWWDDPIVTEIAPLSTFYEAEPEHQDFYRRNGSYHGYCQAVIKPKLAKARSKFAHLIKTVPS